jgi:hypothetical protein
LIAVAHVNPRSPRTRKRRGRPSKFGRPSRVVALTLPEDAIDRLHQVHQDLGWAILTLLDNAPQATSSAGDENHDVELVSVADRRSLIVVNRDAIGDLPGVNVVPISGSRAFLALDIDRGMSDLELAVVDRLADPNVGRTQRRALTKLRTQLKAWRQNPKLHFHTQAIIVVEHRSRQRSSNGR